MSFFLDVKVPGLDGFQRSLAGWDREQKAELRGRLKEAAKLVAEEGRGRTHSERVRSAIAYNVFVASADDYSAVVGPLRKKAFFAHFLEFGTEHSREFPFLGPALEATEDRVVELLGKSFHFPGARA